MKNIKEVLKVNKLLFDGAFGTYYNDLYDTKELPELANTMYKERVELIHNEYIKNGANIIRTNTFASNTVSLNCDINQVMENIKAGYNIALNCAKDRAYVAASIGYIPYTDIFDSKDISNEYIQICKTFLECGADLFVFETFPSLEDIKEAINYIGDKATIIVQFCINQYGYSQLGLSAKKLISLACQNKYIDGVGLNCGVGPSHMYQIFEKIDIPKDIIITALPNAGYPNMINNRLTFDNKNIDYFIDKVNQIAMDYADIVGGCCGSTPEYIKKLKEGISLKQEKKKNDLINSNENSKVIKDNSFFSNKNKKLIAVELAPPIDGDDEKLMDAAHLLSKIGVDVVTFPDSPSGRTRADSILMAEKVRKETGLCVMPHICCRDKNAIAMRSLLLGSHINDINNFLVITGDPVPSVIRGNVKSVFNFDSVGLMRIINDMNDDQFVKSPICYGGAINQTRTILDFEIERVKKKMASGATFFMTQPITSDEGVSRVRRIKEETGAIILCGIMPFVSLKNATFMKNEMTGIEVPDDILARYKPNMSKKEGEMVGISLAKEIMEKTSDFADGYYFSFPFNRVYLLEEILK